MKNSAKRYLVLTTVAAALVVPFQAHAFCFNEAAARYNIPPQLIWSISKHENPRQDPYAINYNTDGSYDFGLMQINTVHEPALRRVGISWQSLADPCTNVMVGTWLLSQHIRAYGYTWKAIGSYHSKTPSRRERYARDIQKKLEGSLFAVTTQQGVTSAERFNVTTNAANR